MSVILLYLGNVPPIMRTSQLALTVLLTVLVTLAVIVNPVAGGQITSGSDIDVYVDNNDIIQTEGNTITVWSTTTVTTRLGPTASRGGAHYIYCLDVNQQEFGCEQGELESDEAYAFEVDGSNLQQGQNTIQARIHRDGVGYNNPLIESVSFSVQALDPSGDVDNDGLNNQDEFTHDTDFENPDTDSDGLSDGEEVNQFGTTPTVADTDSDDLIDGDEVNRYDTDPLEDDTDGDALLDGAEIDRYGTDPLSSDTDSDGIGDGAEINNYDTDPTSPDTDGDGLGDEEELNQYGTDPTQRDTDSDGIGDDDEVNSYDTDPTRPDSDNDGLDDGAEINEHGTDPLITDTDGDGFGDRAEVRQGSDPTDSDATPESSEQSASESEESSVEDSTEAQSSQDQTSVDASSESDESISDGETSSEAGQGGVERGFFTNNPESGIGILQSPMSITMVGIILSILGIGLELRRGV